MAHRFSSIPAGNRALIDTNVLLCAVLIEDGIARRAVEAVRALGHVVCCDEITHHEATRRLERARQKLGLAYDPNTVFDHLIAQLGVLFLPPGDPTIPSGIHRHDRHIPRAAGEFATWVMTDDVELQIGLTAAGFEARNSFEVLEAAAEAGVGLASAPLLPARISAPVHGPTKGWVMAWVTPGAWTGGVPSGNHTVVDIPDFVRLFYDTANVMWRAEFHFAVQTLAAPFAPRPDVPMAVAIGFDGSRVPGKLFIAAGSPSSAPVYHAADTRATVPQCGFAGSALGHTLTNDSHWNGHFRRISAGDRFVSRALWKRLVSVQDIVPHPQLDVLDKALLTIGRLSAFGTVPARTTEL